MPSSQRPDRLDIGRRRRSRRSKSLADVAVSSIGFSHRSSLDVNVFLIEDAVTGARSITSYKARTHWSESGKRPLFRPSMILFQ